jgi:hypothetical protein
MDLRARADELVLDWSQLSAANGLEADAVVPASLTALDGRRIVMAGFLMPLYAVRNIREFALVGSHYTCCFARPPELGDQVIDKLAPGASPLGLTIQPLAVRGTLRIRKQHLQAEGRGPLISLIDVEGAEATALE